MYSLYIVYFALNFTVQRVESIVMRDDDEYGDVLDSPEEIKEKMSSIPIEKPEPSNKRRAIHFFLNGEGVSRLDFLKSKIYPHNQTGVIAKALQLFDLIFREHEKGTKFYIKRRGGGIESFEIFK